MYYDQQYIMCKKEVNINLFLFCFVMWDGIGEGALAAVVVTGRGELLRISGTNERAQLAGLFVIHHHIIHPSDVEVLFFYVRCKIPNTDFRVH